MPAYLRFIKLADTKKVRIENTITGTDDSYDPQIVSVSKLENSTVLYVKSGLFINVSVADVIELIGEDGLPIPFTNNLELARALDKYFFFSPIATGGGGGNALIPDNQIADTYALLPDPVVNSGKIFYVRQATGVWLLGTRRENGFYFSDGATWIKSNEITRYFTDDVLTFKDSTDQTKTLQFQLDQIATGTNRVATFPNKSGIVAFLSDLLPKPAVTPDVYVLRGDTQSWIGVNGLSESFLLGSTEGTTNMNNGIFNGVLQTIGIGKYNRVSFLTSNLSLSPTQSFIVRAALYTINGTLLSQGELTLTNTAGVNRWTIILSTPVYIYSPTAVYMVIGANNNVGGGALSARRITGNQVNDSSLCFSFSQTAGVLPNTLPTVSNETNIWYQAYYGV